MKLDLTKINAEIEAGNVNKQVHPTLPLAIYKYSQQCVFSRAWNETTLLCRGIVLDDLGNVVINSFPKFFNHAEPDGAVEYEKRKAADMDYTVTEKMDGSLIQVTKWKGQIVVSSSGSFTSPQALKATGMIEILIRPYVDEVIEEGYTYLFELIYPENRIVINYGDKVSLVLLAVRETATGNELDPRLWHSAFEHVKTVDMNLSAIENELSCADFINKEGYIVKFADGYRVKMKYDEYCRLHKIVSGVNEKFIWEALKDGQDLETSLAGIPDELFQFVKDTIHKLKMDFDYWERIAKAMYELAKVYPTRKEQAAFLLKDHKDVAPVVFCMLDGKKYDDKLWKKVEPETVTRFGMGEA